jgi:hypothetical protein
VWPGNEIGAREEQAVECVVSEPVGAVYNETHNAHEARDLGRWTNNK